MLNERMLLDILKYNFKYISENIDYNKVKNIPAKKYIEEFFNIESSDMILVKDESTVMYIFELDSKIDFKNFLIHIEIDDKPLYQYSGQPIEGQYPYKVDWDDDITTDEVSFTGYHHNSGYELNVRILPGIDINESAVDNKSVIILTSEYNDTGKVDFSNIRSYGLDLKKLDTDLLPDDARISNSLAVGEQNDIENKFKGVLVNGQGCKASTDCQHVYGKYNEIDKEGKYINIVGNGYSDDSRSNAHTLDKEGNAWFKGNVSIDDMPYEDEHLINKGYLKVGGIEIEPLELLDIADYTEYMLLNLDFSESIYKFNNSIMDQLFYIYSGSSCAYEIVTEKMTIREQILNSEESKYVCFNLDYNETGCIKNLKIVSTQPKGLMLCYDYIDKATRINSAHIKDADRTSIWHNTSNIKYCDYLIWSETRADYLFESCSSLISVGQLYIESTLGAKEMFEDATNLESVEKLVIRYSNDLSYLFSGCKKLKYVGEFIHAPMTNAYHLFYNCSSLVTIPPLDTSLTSDFRYIFSGCTSLETVEKLDVSRLDKDKCYYMFSSCSKLKYINLISNNSDNIIQILSELPSRSNANEGDYIVDISENNIEVIDGVRDYCSGMTLAGWTIKFTGGDN